MIYSIKVSPTNPDLYIDLNIRQYFCEKKAEGRAVMGKKKEKPIDLNNLEAEEKLKYEVAEELGLLDRVLSQGWKSLTSKETGRIGGLVTKKKKQGQ